MIEAIETRAIPSSGERLPVIGLGTWQSFDIGASTAARAQRGEVLRVLFEAGGAVIDSSPMYGRSEAVVGDLVAATKARDRAFFATKVWTTGKSAGIAQMEKSFQLFQVRRIDLMQIHNLVDWRTHLATLRRWKGEGRIRYLGITHYSPSAHEQLEAVMRAEPLDFVQLDYALDDRAAERRLLPLAIERGVGVLVNRPFGGGGLLRRLHRYPLPGWAGEIGCTSWGQVLLKYILANQAVTCVIPGTSEPQHMMDNMAAGRGAFPDFALRLRMIEAADA